MLRIPVITSRLAANVDVFRALLQNVTAEQARWKPSPDKWSLLEVTTHLADEEKEDFGTRLRLVLQDPEAPWPPIDPEGWATSRRYNEGDLDVALARFLQERSRTIAWLESLERPDWSMAYQHPKAGPIRAGDLLVSWLGHDMIHIRQMNRLHREYLVAHTEEFSPDYAGTW